MVVFVELKYVENMKIECKSLRHDAATNSIHLIKYDGTTIIITQDVVKGSHLDEDLPCGDFIE